MIAQWLPWTPAYCNCKARRGGGGSATLVATGAGGAGSKAADNAGGIRDDTSRAESHHHHHQYDTLLKSSIKQVVVSGRGTWRATGGRRQASMLEYALLVRASESSKKKAMGKERKRGERREDGVGGGLSEI